MTTRSNARRYTSKATAHHEAGHAVAVWYVGEHIYRIHVLSGEQVRDGVAITDRRNRVTSGVHGSVESSVSYNLALSPAQCAKVMGLPLDSARIVAAVSMMVDMAGPLAQARVSRKDRAYMCYASTDDSRHFIDTVEDFPKDMRNALEKEAEEGARKLVRIGWPAITALAEALVSRGSLQGGVATRIIARAWPNPPCLPGVPRMPWAEETLRRAAKVTPRTRAR